MAIGGTFILNGQRIIGNGWIRLQHFTYPDAMVPTGKETYVDLWIRIDQIYSICVLTDGIHTEVQVNESFFEVKESVDRIFELINDDGETSHAKLVKEVSNVYNLLCSGAYLIDPNLSVIKGLEDLMIKLTKLE